jgi:hypothetical protein
MCLAQNAGGPDTGAEGVGQNGTTIPSQRGDAAIADIAMAVTPVGPERAGAAVAERLGILARIGRFFKNLLGLEEKVVVDANKLNHIFGKAAHNLGPLVEKFGSQEATFNAVQSATQTAVKSGGITGVFETTVNVAGQNVVVRGNVIEGTARIGTFFIP